VIPCSIPTTPPSELATALSLAEVMRALGLDHAASILEPATAKAIANNDSPTTLLDQLMREQLRVQSEHGAQMALVHRTATLDFVKDRSNVVFVGPSGVGKTHLANAIGQLACLDMWGRLLVGDVRFTVGHCARAVIR
jgi:chromosomal replication initiation ATPase DnaA